MVVAKLNSIPQPALWILRGHAPHEIPNQAGVSSVSVTAIRPTTHPATTPCLVNPL